ncbi:hypothetical protein ACPC54_29430 [Kitasatospora sp. NPDC094028]
MGVEPAAGLRRLQGAVLLAGPERAGEPQPEPRPEPRPESRPDALAARADSLATTG